MSVSATVSKNRLLKLADLLQNLPRDRFDYGQWVGEDWKGRADLSCGTTACALGWATTIPSLRKAGLRLTQFDYGQNGGYVVLMEKGEQIHSEGAAAVVFGLSHEEVSYLFNGDHIAPHDFRQLSNSPGWDATPKQVAKHIRQFVKVKFPD